MIDNARVEKIKDIVSVIKASLGEQSIDISTGVLTNALSKTIDFDMLRMLYHSEGRDLRLKELFSKHSREGAIGKYMLEKDFIRAISNLVDKRLE